MRAKLTSRCYEYAAPALTRCYGASYDAVGNPVELRDPEGVDVLEYDALDRLTKVTRSVGGVVFAVEDYSHNALGALSVNAGVAVDHQRPRLSGGGLADAAVPNTLAGQPVTLDPAGRVTSLRGVNFGWSLSGNLTSIGGSFAGTDAFGRRVWFGGEFYVNEGDSRVARVDYAPDLTPPGRIQESFLYDGVDHPLRLATTALFNTRACPPGVPCPPLYRQSPVLAAYYELDLAGNVRRLRAAGGEDLGGYRYSAFGKTLEDTVVHDLVLPTGYDRAAQPLRWKARPHLPVAGELYDMRARWWSPELGAFLSVDDYAFHDATTTLWGWPGQNPIRWSDPSGRSGWPTTFKDFLFDLEDTGTLRDAQAFSLGVVSSIPLYVGPRSPTIGQVFAEIGIKSDPCAKTANVAEKLLGAALVGAVTRGAGDAESALHHVFPQQFRDEFAAIGLDIDQYTLKLPVGVHRDVHSNGWNAEWADFFDKGGGPPTAQEAQEFATQLIQEYGLDQYLPFRPYR